MLYDDVCYENSKNMTVCVLGKAQFIHMGEQVDGVDMRAEVGLLSHNILIRGEMEPGCYGNEACKFFNFDTFGGHLKVHSCMYLHSLGQLLQLIKQVSLDEKILCVHQKHWNGLTNDENVHE